MRVTDSRDNGGVGILALQDHGSHTDLNSRFQIVATRVASRQQSGSGLGHLGHSHTGDVVGGFHWAPSSRDYGAWSWVFPTITETGAETRTGTGGGSGGSGRGAVGKDGKPAVESDGPGGEGVAGGGSVNVGVGPKGIAEALGSGTTIFAVGGANYGLGPSATFGNPINPPQTFVNGYAGTAFDEDGNSIGGIQFIGDGGTANFSNGYADPVFGGSKEYQTSTNPLGRPIGGVSFIRTGGIAPNGYATSASPRFGEGAADGVSTAAWIDGKT